MPISPLPRAGVPDRPVLLTGAAGRLGRVLAPALAAKGWTLRLTDRLELPYPLPPAARFTAAELTDAAAIEALARGCGAILHFGGIPRDQGFEAVLEANLRGAAVLYEVARRVGCRVVFASSNHVAGFHARTQPLDADCALRPDGFYGLSKAYGELLARLYWDKHAVPSVLVRIGSCTERPLNARMRATWLAPADLVGLVERAVLAPEVACPVVWGVSANASRWWHGDNRAQIGWQPQDSADRFPPADIEPEPSDPITLHYQGGSSCSRDSTRAGTGVAQ